ncbi:MAG: hypothetical protein WCI22_16895 [Actinomycetota bacterium]
MLSIVDYVWTILIFAVIGGIAWFSYGLEPHYASKDGRRFLCNTQEFIGGRSVERKREARVTVLPEGTLHVVQKKSLRRQMNVWTLVGTSPNPPKRLQIYVAQRQFEGQPAPTQLMLRLPTKSRVIPVLDEILAANAVSPRPPSQGTA